jgi:hypothetical protein
MGISAYALPPSPLPSLDDYSVEEVRAAFGGQLQTAPSSKTRWYLSDLEAAEHASDTGWLASAAQLIRAMRKDGVLAGVLSTRTDGLVRLPKRFRGDQRIVAALEQGHELSRSVFDEMFPPAEIALLASDGVTLGVGVAELVKVEGRDYPVLVRLDPEFLIYRWNENRWYFRSIAGLIPITPGDGRWILHVPGGRNAPWQHGLWRALGRAWIRKEHANMHKDNWEAKLANPARVAVAPQGATEEQQENWFRRVMAWGVNTVFGMKPGYDVRLLESNGRGWDSFNQTIKDQNNEMTIALAGQTVTTDGGAGFSNADIHKSIRSDLIQATADALAYTLNTQGLPPFILERFGEEALDNGAIVQWDTKPAKDQSTEATAMVQAATAITTLRDTLSASGKVLDVDALCVQFGIPVVAPNEVVDAEADKKPRLSLVKEAA